MARLSKADHPKILQAVDGEHRKVAEVAAEYGCTPAAVYALLAKLRKAGQGADPPVIPAPAVVAVDLFAAPVVTPDKPMQRRVDAAPLPAPPPIMAPAVPAPVVAQLASAPEEVSANVTDMPRRLARPAGRGGVGASLARPGYGLAMRTADGDESMTPFRSLDDLLSAIKPILRSAARSPDAVWFSIQPVDLASLDSDAA